MTKNKIKILSTKTLSQKLDANVFDFFQHDFISTSAISFQIESLHDYNIFTSQNAVESVLKNEKINEIKSKPCLCVGEKTKQMLLDKNFEVADYSDYAEELTQLIKAKYVNLSFTFFAGNLSLPTLPNFFKMENINFARVLVYETIKTPKTYNEAFDALLFFSPSGVESFLKENKITNQKCFCIGQTTAQTLKNYTNNPLLIAKKPTVESVLETLKDYYQ